MTWPFPPSCNGEHVFEGIAVDTLFSGPTVLSSITGEIPKHSRLTVNYSVQRLLFLTNGVLYSSEDGCDWLRTPVPISAATSELLAASNSKSVIIWHKDINEIAIYDLLHWGLSTIDLPEPPRFIDSDMSGETLVMIGSGSCRLHYSIDSGENWEPRALPVKSCEQLLVQAHQGRFFALYGSGEMYISSDSGKSWTFYDFTCPTRPCVIDLAFAQSDRGDYAWILVGGRLSLLDLETNETIIFNRIFNKPEISSARVFPNEGTQRNIIAALIWSIGIDDKSEGKFTHIYFNKSNGQTLGGNLENLSTPAGVVVRDLLLNPGSSSVGWFSVTSNGTAENTD